MSECYNGIVQAYVPYQPDGQVGKACNRILHECPHDWLVIFDHDVLLGTNPHWNYICRLAIAAQPKAGLFTAYCNNIGNDRQKLEAGVACGDRVLEHSKLARTQWLDSGHRLTQLSKAVAGFFLLINKRAALAVDGFPGIKLFMEDWIFVKKLLKAGYGVYRIDGLYMYHRREREAGGFVEEDPTACDLWKSCGGLKRL